MDLLRYDQIPHHTSYRRPDRGFIRMVGACRDVLDVGGMQRFDVELLCPRNLLMDQTTAQDTLNRFRIQGDLATFSTNHNVNQVPFVFERKGLTDSELARHFTFQEDSSLIVGEYPHHFVLGKSCLTKTFDMLGKYAFIFQLFEINPEGGVGGVNGAFCSTIFDVRGLYVSTGTIIPESTDTYNGLTAPIDQEQRWQQVREEFLSGPDVSLYSSQVIIDKEEWKSSVRAVDLQPVQVHLLAKIPLQLRAHSDMQQFSIRAFVEVAEPKQYNENLDLLEWERVPGSESMIEEKFELPWNAFQPSGKEIVDNEGRAKTTTLNFHVPMNLLQDVPNVENKKFKIVVEWLLDPTAPSLARDETPNFRFKQT